MKLIKNTLLFIAIFLTLQTTAQNFSGTITNTEAEVIENAQIVLQYPNASMKTIPFIPMLLVFTQWELP